MNTALADRIGAIAAGTLRAQKFIHSLRLDQAVPAEALEQLKQVQVEFGCDSPAVGAWLAELAKRVR
jgi:hypothetical protein